MDDINYGKYETEITFILGKHFYTKGAEEQCFRVIRDTVMMTSFIPTRSRKDRIFFTVISQKSIYFR